MVNSISNLQYVYQYTEAEASGNKVTDRINTINCLERMNYMSDTSKWTSFFKLSCLLAQLKRAQTPGVNLIEQSLHNIAYSTSAFGYIATYTMLYKHGVIICYTLLQLDRQYVYTY